MYKIGNKVKVNDSNENYDDFRDKILIITHIARNKDEHPGYDEGMNGMSLFDFETENGEEIPFSLYSYEIRKI